MRKSTLGRFVLPSLLLVLSTGCNLEKSAPTGPAYPDLPASKLGTTGGSSSANRAPDPEPGGQLGAPNMAHVVAEVAASHPDALRNSCQEHGGSWEFMDLVVDALRRHDTRWGYNWKRGNVGDPSLDAVNYHWGAGEDEGSRDVYTFDVIIGHCGDYPTPAWIDLTDPYGAGAMWTGRGRF
jgi:hypothetical protein